MKVMFPSKTLVLTAGLALFSQVLNAQNNIQLFTPIDVRTSAGSTSYSTPYTMGSSTISVTCNGTPGATLSRTADGTGNLLVDNNIFVTVMQGTSTITPSTNVCPLIEGQENPGQGIYTNDCYAGNWRTDSGTLNANQTSTDTWALTDGVSPITLDSYISSVIQGTPFTLTVSTLDEGGALASSSIYLTTSCTINGVTGPSTVGGNPITGGSGQTQTFAFNPLDTKKVDFTYDVGGVTNFSGAPNGSIPQTTDSPIDVTRFRPDWVAKTPFATTSCFVHFGEVLADGVTQACKLYTLECISPDGQTVTGANCPKSTAANERVVDHFDGPPLHSLPNIYNNAGKLITREGAGFLMASEDWAPSLPTPAGQCTFEAASGLSGVACPRNLLRDFSGPGIFSGTGLTTNPNSTFISIYGVPQPLTDVTLRGAKGGNWVNTHQPKLDLDTATPNFTKGANTINPVNGLLVPLDGAANFIPAPVKSITFGISPASAVQPTPLQEATLSDPITGTDITIMNSACPTTFTALTQPVFDPPDQTLGPLPDGKYMVHYYAEDCAGTQELRFTTSGEAEGGPIWSTSFYTYPVNIDTTPPVVTIQPLATTYIKLNAKVNAIFSCTDAIGGSGVTHCGTNAFGTESTYDTGLLQTKINTSSLGLKTITINATDGAGNSSSASATYTVIK